MPVTLEAKVEIKRTSGVPEDAVTNTWHFRSQGDASDVDDFEFLSNELGGFYFSAHDIYGVSSFFSQALSRAVDGASITWYDLSDPIPRAPRYYYEFNLNAAIDTSQSIPAELAVCLSFRGSLTGIGEGIGESVHPRARRRNRVYLGPLNNYAIDGVRPNNEAVVSGDFRDIISEAAGILHANCSASGRPWVVHSPTDDNVHSIVEWWIDDAFDVQRRRGNLATERTVGAPPVVP